jgi:uridylate kinase
MKKAYIVSLGGSLIVPKDGIDWQFLKKFRRLILEQVRQVEKFYLIYGGGTTCRKYN